MFILKFIKMKYFVIRNYEFCTSHVWENLSDIYLSFFFIYIKREEGENYPA